MSDNVNTTDNESFARARAMNETGLHFEHGDGCRKDAAEAVRQYTCSLDFADTAQAYYWLAVHYASGDGVGQDVNKAYRYYAKAACLDDSGFFHSRSLYQTGVAMLGMIAGLKVAVDYELGLKCFELASDHGCQLASYMLARLYKNGLTVDGACVVEANPTKSFEYLSKSLVGEFTESVFYYQYGMFLLNGIGTNVNTAAGRESLCRSAEMGCSQAKEYLENNPE